MPAAGVYWAALGLRLENVSIPIPTWIHKRFALETTFFLSQKRQWFFFFFLSEALYLIKNMLRATIISR